MSLKFGLDAITFVPILMHQSPKMFIFACL